jgi:hypothetical protein
LHHQAVALHGAMMHPKMRCMGKSIGFAADAEIALFHQEQQKRMIALARTTTTEKGRPTDDKRSFAQSLILASASSPNSKPIGNRKRAKVLGLPYSTTHRLFKNAKVVQSQLKNIEEGLSWSTVRRKKSRSNVTEEMRAKLHALVLNHPHVVDSPIARDTLLIKDPETGKKVRTGKILLEVSVREFHNNLLDLPANGGLDCARNAEGKVLISDTALRYLLPPQLRRMTESHKQMCGCEVCLCIRSLHSTLIGYRSRASRSLASETTTTTIYSETVLPGGKPWHPKPRDALQEIQCPNVGDLGFPHWNCVLRRCDKCPKYPIPLEEQGTMNNDPSVPSLVDAQYMVSWAMGSRSAQPVFPARKDPKFPCNKGKLANENISRYWSVRSEFL